MSAFDLLAAVYEATIGTVDEAVTSAEELAEALLEDFETGAQAFLDHAAQTAAADAEAFVEVNDTLLVLLGTVAGNSNAEERIRTLVEGWLAIFGDVAEALDDLLARLFETFATQAATLLLLLRALLAARGDFEAFFVKLLVRAAASPATFRGAMETRLLPVLVAALGLPALGPDAVVRAVLKAISSDAPELRRPVTPFDLGLPTAGLSEWQAQTLATRFPARAGAAMLALLLENLRRAAGFQGALVGFTAHPALTALFGPVLGYFGDVFAAFGESLRDLFRLVVERLLFAAENDREIEMRVLELARFTPLGLLLLKVGVVVKLLTSPAPYANLIFNAIEDDPSLAVQRLPPPTPERKYVLFSDIHRDAKSDAQAPYAFGSIDHFLPHRALYGELLERFDREGYVILEGGDCEELWFFRDFPFDPLAKMDEIVNDTHAAIYDRLARLHAEGRYFRIFGNHDSYLRDADVFAVLERRMNPAGTAPFRIFDFLIVEGVKTMHDVWFYLGLDSDPNRQRRPLIITHGHQWDFWNCDANAILGKLVVTAIVTPLDQLDDPLRDIAGISSSGSPAFDFQQAMAGVPVYSSFPCALPANVQIDAIQHQRDRDRRFLDDIQYSETLASLMGLLLAVRPGATDDPPFRLPGDLALLNLLATGHTHNPQNEPYYDLKRLPYVKEAIDALELVVLNLTNGAVRPRFGLIKSLFLNSGVSGWYEQCVWGIDLGAESHGTGQPKLVFWTANTRPDRPHHMDWELPHVDRSAGLVPPGDRLKDAFDDAFRALLDATGIAPARQALALDAAAPVGLVAGRLATTWRPEKLHADFAGDAPTGATFAEFAAHVVFGLLHVTSTGRAAAFDFTLGLPAGLAKDLAAAVKSPFLPKALPLAERWLPAVGLLAVDRDLAVHGLRRRMGTPADAAPSCLAWLLALATLRAAAPDFLACDFRLEGGTLRVRVHLRAGAKGTPPRLLPGAPADPSDGAKAPGIRDLAVRVHTVEGGVPLRDLRVQLELPASQAGRPEKRERPRVLAGARTDQAGHAQLRRALPADLALAPTAELVVYAAEDQPIHRVRIAGLLARNRRELVIPVSLAELRRLRFLGPKPRPTTDEKIAKLCAHWRKRLAGKGDPTAKDDLCLTEFVLATIASLDAPRTELQREAARRLRPLVAGRRAEFKRMLDLARRSAKGLRACLGREHPPCRLPGDLDDLGRHLLRSNSRLLPLGTLFANPVPDPAANLGPALAGPGIPTQGPKLVKVCEVLFQNGELDPAIAAQIEGYLEDPRVLSAPSINVVRVWEAGFGGGDYIRTLEVGPRTLNVRSVVTSGETISVEDHAIALDVPLDDPACLVQRADTDGRQVALTDVQPGQRVVLFGSGFVSRAARVRILHHAWEADTDDGVLVPVANALPVSGLQSLTFDVHGSPNPPAPGANATTSSDDFIVFEWPAAASAQGLYRLQLEFDNESAFPTSVFQNPDDCSLVVSRDPVSSPELCFVVLPAVETPALRVVADEVECDDLTDPEHFLGIPWPDDLHLSAASVRHRLAIDFARNEATVTSEDPVQRSASTLLWGPGTWSPGLRVFPAGAGFTELDLFEFVTIEFRLDEVEGDFDRFAVSLLYAAAVIVATLILAAIVVAAVVALLVAGYITAGVAAAILAPVLGFIVGAAFSSLIGLAPLLLAAVDGQDRILTRSRHLDGASAAFQLSPVRFHRALWAGGPFALTDDTANSALGGTYRLAVEVRVDD